MKTTLLTSATVTKKLKSLGFYQSKYLTSRIRGWGTSTDGFETEAEVEYKNGRTIQKWHYTQKRGHHQRAHYVEDKVNTGRIFVSYQQSTSVGATYDPDLKLKRLTQIKRALIGAGYTVDFATDSDRLIVTK